MLDGLFHTSMVYIYPMENVWKGEKRYKNDWMQILLHVNGANRISSWLVKLVNNSALYWMILAFVPIKLSPQHSFPSKNAEWWPCLHKLKQNRWEVFEMELHSLKLTSLPSRCSKGFDILNLKPRFKAILYNKCKIHNSYSLNKTKMIRH